MIREQVARPVEFVRENPAFQSGWRDGRFGSGEAPASGAGGDGRPAGRPEGDRRDYCRGYREGRRIREMLRKSV